MTRTAGNSQSRHSGKARRTQFAIRQICVAVGAQVADRGEFPAHDEVGVAQCYREPDVARLNLQPPKHARQHFRQILGN
jgi:hypothetical protein